MKTLNLLVLFLSVIDLLKLCECYVQLSTLKSSLFHKIMINNKIKKDFKKITSTDAYQLASFWHDELLHITSTENKDEHQDIGFLYKPTNEIFKSSLNLTDFKYGVISDVENENTYYIWRPKIQICLPCLNSIQINEADMDNFQKPLLYPSFRETMYLLSLNLTSRTSCAIVNNIVQSPYWNEPLHDSYKTMQTSMEQYFVGYLKYRGLSYVSD